MAEDEWEDEVFDVRSIVPVTNMQVVYSLEPKMIDADTENVVRRKDGSGLQWEKLDFIGVASVTLRRFRGSRVMTETRCRNAIVGLQLIEGEFEVCNEHCNYVGMQPLGANPLELVCEDDSDETSVAV